MTKENIALFKLSNAYYYALIYLHDKGFLKNDTHFFACAFICHNEEQGCLASPIDETIFTTFCQQVDYQPATPLLLQNFLTNPQLVSTCLENDTPFIQHNNLLYSRRLYLFQQNLIETIKTQLLPKTIALQHDNSLTLNYLNAIQRLNPLLQQAVETLLNSSLLILTGGPGFGKTTALSILLEALLFTQPQPTRENYTMALAAPTGRAASRMQSSLSEKKEFVLLQQFMPQKALTLHQLLRYNPTTGQCFFNQDNFLPYNVVAIDESSMIDAYLFNFLFKALKQDTTLILLGDANQLPSVGTGALFADLIKNYSHPQHQLHHNIITLTQNYRSNAAIFNLAQVALTGNKQQFYAHLQPNNAVEVLPLSTPHTLTFWLKEKFNLATLPKAENFTSNHYADEPLVSQFLKFYNQFILLTPLREGSSYSAKNINKAINNLQSSQQPYHGQPIIINNNLTNLNLANGDRGVIISLPNPNNANSPERKLFVFFEGHSNPILLDEIGYTNWETAYALTIHKSQGSEFDTVAVLIPPLSGRVLSQKLLYTALTRAKNQVYLIKDDTELNTALGQNQERYSAITDILVNN